MASLGAWAYNKGSGEGPGAEPLVGAKPLKLMAF